MKDSWSGAGAGVAVIGRKKWGVPGGEGCFSWIKYRRGCLDVKLTVTEIRASVPTASVILVDFFATRDGVLGTFGLDELVVASAAVAFALAHFPSLQSALGNVLAEKDVER